MTYDIQLRQRVINLIKIKTSIVDIIKYLQVSKTTIYRWISLEKTNKLKPAKKRTEKLTTESKFFIRDYIIKNCNFNYKLLLRRIKQKYNITIQKSTLYETIKKIDITKKKIVKRIKYLKRKKEKKNLQKLRKELKKVPKCNVISLDETSVDTHISNDYGWSKKGVRLIKKYKKYRIKYSTICSIMTTKIIHSYTKKGSINGEDFLVYIKDLINKLDVNKKYCILLDNARIHHYKKLKEHMNTVNNVVLVYNVAYSPEYNPIELVFNELKNKLKKKIINKNNIQNNIENILKGISVNNLQIYFNKAYKNLYE